ncbi:hypothetical protein BCV70DRAFT_1044 [Testicularia cyperi]|uniref:DNA topoisomerase IV, alpha subunit n=1 Tax=Testicularia cyperi TaxID=1882483 RepID=A0A317XYX4_9BASI|nr:hypothetical protein BCV70DRAFT_1044 [Testicularia cyperi]
MAAPLAFLGLFDADPYGIDIHRVYRRSCPRANIQWLGMELQDFLPSLNLNREPHSPSLTTDAPEANTTLIPLKPTERTKALSLLAKLDETRLASLASQPKPQPRSEPQVETTWRHMLGDMLQHGLKVEIEAAHSWNRVSVDQGQSGDLGLGLGLGLEGYLHHRWRLLKAQESSMK